VTTETLAKTENICAYCHRKFVKESTLAVHLCEPKRRMQQRNETGVQIGYQAYMKFYEMTQGSARNKTYEHFAHSSYYRAFVKFGRYCQDIKAINILRFIDWIVKNNKKLDHWCRDTVYEEYLHDYLRTEPVVDALSRTLEQAIRWEEETGYPACDYLRHANANKLCYAVRSGRISAWVLYNCSAGVELLGRLNQDQVATVWVAIDTEYWQRRFKDYAEDTVYAKEMLTKAGW
jgi:hypothetical protein